MLDYSEYSYTVYTVEYGIEKSRTIYTNVANFKRYYIIILLRGIPKNTPQKAKIPKNTPLEAKIQKNTPLYVLTCTR